MQYLPNAPTCPPLRGYERTSTGFALWLSLERGLKVTKNGKPCQERPSRCRCPRARQPNTIKQPTNVRARGHTFLINLWGVIRIKNDNRYERVQKIDPRNTLRGMKTKETIFLNSLFISNFFLKNYLS